MGSVPGAGCLRSGVALGEGRPLTSQLERERSWGKGNVRRGGYQRCGNFRLWGVEEEPDYGVRGVGLKVANEVSWMGQVRMILLGGARAGRD